MEDNSQKNPLTAKKIALFALYAVIALCLFFTVLSFNDVPSILEELKDLKLGYVMIAVLMVLVYLALYPLSLCILTKAKGCDIKLSTTYTIAMTEHFFNGITPLATGGQPFQAHSYTKAGVKISDSTGLLLTNLLIYMAVTTAFSLVGLAYFDIFTASISPVWVPIIIVGYSLNFFVLVAIVVLGTSKRLRGGLVRLIRFICRIRPLRRFEAKTASVDAYFVQVQEAFHELTKKKGAFILAVLTKILSFAFLYSATFFILMAMDVPVGPEHFPLAMFGISFAMTAVGFIPTPGASGGAKESAAQVLRSIIIFIIGSSVIETAPAMASGVMLIWRLISYYFVMAVSLAFYIGLEMHFSKRKKKART